MYVDHSKIPPIYDEHSKILILGSIPSPKSRDASFYYAHPQNRFWRVLCDVLGEAIPASNDEKTAMLLKRGVALWDVLYSCDIENASDNSIKNPLVNDFGDIFSAADIRAVFCTGGTAAKLYRKHTAKQCIALPSTSPANCRMKYEALFNAYSVIRGYLV